jgi:hypothetical protein
VKPPLPRASVCGTALACLALSATGAPTGGDAPCPVPAPWSFHDAAWQRSAARERVCLNGFWRFWPDDNAGKIPDADTGWCWMKVPGSWPTSHRWGLFPYPFVPVMSARWAKELPIDIDRGNWHSKNNAVGEPIPFDQVQRAWYQREITFPSRWEGKRILLSADNVELSANVFIDGVAVGRIAWPHGEVDLTRQAVFDRPVLLSLRLLGTGGDIRGLAGDVFLEARPQGAVLEDVYLVPSVSRETLAIRGRVVGAATQDGCKIAGQADLDGRCVFSFDPQPISPAADGEFSLTVPWENAARWDFDTPVLHDVRIRLASADGTTLDETPPIRMGFREFVAEGRQFLLNGMPVHFRSGFYKPIGASTGLADEATVRRVVSRMREQGCNLLVSSIYSSGPGQLHYPRQFLETCDELGVAVQLQLNKATQFMTHSEQDGWQLPPDGLARWEEAVRPQILRQRQHPSLFFWAANANIFAGAEKANPRDWILPERPTQRMPGWDTFTEILRASDAAIRRLDGERPIITLGNGNFGDVISAYVYPNFYPRQQQREMPSLWAERGLKPLMIAEWGNPADISFSAHRADKPRWPDLGDHAEPLPVEFSAIFDGDAAYALDAAGQSLYAGLPQLHEQPFSIYHWTRQQAVRFGMGPGFFKTKIDSIREVLPTWRAYGVSAIGVLEPYEHRQIAQPERDHWANPAPLSQLKTPGVKPDFHPWFEAAWTHPEADRYFALSPHGAALREASAPIFAFIGGAPSQDGGIANRTATATLGEPVRCALICGNDARQSQKVSAQWRTTLNDAEIETGASTWALDAGARAVEPLSFEIHTTTGAFALEVQFESNGRKWTDARTWHVRGPPEPIDERGLVVYDPPGDTATLLAELNIPFSSAPAAGPLPEGARLLLVGEHAIKPAEALPIVYDAENQGVGILVLAQHADVVSSRLGLRYADVVVQQLTLRRPESAELRGASGATIQNWAGSSKVFDPHPDMTTVHHYALPMVDWLGFKNPRMFRWGNTGAVASVLPEKPVAGGWAYFVDGQFDMGYFGLARHSGGLAPIWLCQLDIVQRTARDSTATHLLRDLVLAGLRHAPAARRPCLTAGAAAADWSRRLKVASTAWTPGTALPAKGILLASADGIATLDLNELSQAVESGLKVLAVGWEQPALATITGQKVKLTPREVFYEPPLVNLPAAFAGLGPADLFWHGPLPCQAIASIHADKIATENLSSYWSPNGTIGHVARGHGEVAMLQPDHDVAGRPWQKRAGDKRLRVIATVLANWSAPIADAPLVRYLAEPPAQDEKRWDSGHYPRPTTPADDPMRWQSW